LDCVVDHAMLLGSLLAPRIFHIGQPLLCITEIDLSQAFVEEYFGRKQLELEPKLFVVAEL
jgi:hypothetical protein